MTNEATHSQRISLDELMVLNNEIIALVRAGVPLDRGLIKLGDDLPGRLGQIARGAGQRIKQGQSLGESLDLGTGPFAGVYKAVIEAGQESGQLAAALQGLAVTARRAIDLKKHVSHA